MSSRMESTLLCQFAVSWFVFFLHDCGVPEITRQSGAINLELLFLGIALREECQLISNRKLGNRIFYPCQQLDRRLSRMAWANSRTASNRLYCRLLQYRLRGCDKESFRRIWGVAAEWPHRDSGEAERSFRREAERHSGLTLTPSERSDTRFSTRRLKRFLAQP
jgi:hypothetical protein